MGNVYDVDSASGDLYSRDQMDWTRNKSDKAKAKIQKNPASVARAKDRRLTEGKPLADGTTQTYQVSDAEKLIICRLDGEGKTPAEIAVLLNRGENTVKRVLRKAEEMAKKVGVDWKQIQKQKAVSAVNDALDSKIDLYKRGNLGVQVLKGLNEYSSDDNGLNVIQLFNQIPEAQRARYITLEDEESKIIEGETNGTTQS